MRLRTPDKNIETAVLSFDSKTGALISFNDAALHMLEQSDDQDQQELTLGGVEEHFISNRAFSSSKAAVDKANKSDRDYAINIKQRDGRVFSLSRHNNAGKDTILVVKDITSAAQQTRRERLNRLIFERMCQAPTPGTSLDGLLRAICLCTGWPFGEIWTTRNGKLVRARARQAASWSGARSPDAMTPDAKSCPTIVAQAGLSGEIERVNSFHDYTSTEQNDLGDLFVEETGASIAIPLKAGSGVFAILHFGFAHSKPFDQMSIDLLRGMTEQLAMALKYRLNAFEEASAQKQLNEVLMAAGDAIVSIDSRHRIQLFNRQAEVLFGFAKEEVMGQHLHLLLPQSAHASHAQHLKKYDHTSPGARFMGGRPEVKGRRKDGSEFPAEASVSRTTIGDEIVYTAVVRDLSALKKAQEALFVSEEKMRAIVEAMPFGLSISHAESGKIIFVNEAFCALAETEFDEIVGRELTSFLDLQTSGQVIAGKRGTERQLRTASGALRWCMTASVSMNIAGSKAILCGYYDVTDRRTAVEALRISAHNLGEAERIAHLGNWQWDFASGSLRFSDEAYRIIGIEPEGADITYVQFLASVHSADREAVDRSLQVALADSDAYEGGFRIVTPEGAQRYVQLQAEIERDEAGCVSRMMGTIQDMTDLKHVQEELWAARELAEAANRAKSQFLANMSHELRTPLNAIIGFSEIMAMSAENPLPVAQYQEYAGDINLSGRKLLNVVDDILDLSNIECGHSELDESEFDIADVIDMHARRLANRLAVARLSFIQQISQPTPRLLADRKLFDQMIENLLSNAVKFTPAGGEIHIRTSLTDDGSLCIEVEDNGIGISSQDMERIFLPFVQAEGHLSRRYDGVGLGLALTKEYVRLHDGVLHFRSEVGAGTKVLIQFPPTRVIAAPKEAAESNNMPGPTPIRSAASG
ncbi:MAG: PAS domain S-box protein [Parvibaculum sp.]